MKNIAYITAAKKGLSAFTYKELELLEKKDIKFSLCLTQLSKGVFLPHKNWSRYVPNYSGIIISVMLLIFRDVNLFIKLSKEANKKGLYKWFTIAIYFFYKLKKQNISSIHCQMGGNKLYIGFFLSKLMKIRLTVTIHAYELYSKDAYDKVDILSEIYNYCDTVITISDFNRNELIKRFNVNEEKIKKMYLYPANYEKEIDKKKILVVGNWVEKKGYGFLLEAIKGLNRDDYFFWIVGGSINDDNAIDLTKMVHDKQLSDRVKILGFQPREVVNILLESCDIFCLPSVSVLNSKGQVSDREGIPVSLMEAMKYGKPIISTYHAGIPELVENYLVEEDNVADLINKLDFLLSNPNMWEEIGNRNKILVDSKFNENNVNILIEQF